MRATALTVSIIGLVGTAGIHLWQYLVRYDAFPNGWMFVAQAVTALVLVGVLVAGRRGIGAPSAAAAFQAVSLIALGLSFAGTFFGFSEDGFRPETAVTIAYGFLGLAGALTLGIANEHRADDDAPLLALVIGRPA